MLTEGATLEEVEAFERFPGARVISTDVLTTETDREPYLSCAASVGNLLLDPDAGLRENPPRKLADSPKYLFFEELVRVTSARRDGTRGDGPLHADRCAATRKG